MCRIYVQNFAIVFRADKQIEFRTPETMRWHGGNTLYKLVADQLLYGPYIVGSCLALATALKDPARAGAVVPVRLPCANNRLQSGI